MLTHETPPRDALRPVCMNNARPPRITAAAGTRFAGATCPGTVIFFPGNRALRPGSFYSRFITLATLLDQDFSHCPIFPTAALNKFGPCLSPNVADRPLRPAKHSRLGKPLPYQQPKTT